MGIKRDSNGIVKLTGTRWDYLIYLFVSVGTAYAFASLAIDTGSLWYYAGGIAFILLTIRIVIAGIKQFRRP